MGDEIRLPPPLRDIPQLAVPPVDPHALQGVQMRRHEAAVDERNLKVVLHVEIVQPLYQGLPLRPIRVSSS